MRTPASKVLAGLNDPSRYRSTTARYPTPESARYAGLPSRAQAKPIVPVMSDRFESEADAVADLVVQKLEAAPHDVEEIRRAPAEEKVAPAPTAPAHVAATAQTKKETAVGAGSSGSKAPRKVVPKGLDSSAVAGGGSALSATVRRLIEPVMGYDFGSVRIHTGGLAAKMARDVGARAFTVGSNIAFAAGQFTLATREGLHLLAHELTHVVQQGAAGPRLAEVAGPSIGRVGLGGGVYQREADEEAEGGGILAWLATLGGDALKAIPGWDMAIWLLGYDPLTSKVVERNGANLVKGIVGLVPGLGPLYAKVEESGLVKEAFAWIEQTLAKHRLTRERIDQVLSEAKADAGFMDVLGPVTLIEKHVLPVFQDVKAFASELVDKVVVLIRDTLIDPLLGELKKAYPEGYELLTQLLARDPVTGKAVKRTATSVLTAFLRLSESGKEYLEQLKSSGTLEKLQGWLDKHVAELKLNEEEIKRTISAVWDALDANAVLHPLQTFEQICGIVGEPVGRIVAFVGAVCGEALKLVKAWALGKLEAVANETPGYALIGVILEKDPITGEVVPRTPENFIRGFMSLVPGGEEKYQELAKAGTIENVVQWLTDAVGRLGLSWEKIVQVFRDAWNSLTIRDLVNPWGAFVRIVGLFAEPVGRVLAFAGEVALKVVEYIFVGVMGSSGEKVLAIINRSKEAFDTILKDPIAFAMNLMAAVKGGFEKFSGNILEHLKAGIFGWLVGALEGAGVTLPEVWDLKGIVSLVLQILGITYARIRAKLVEHLGEEVVGKLEATFDLLRGLVTEGPAFLWDKVVEYLGNLEELVIGGIKDWVVTKIVGAAITKILSLLNPVGAIVQAVLAVYNTIMVFVERIQQIIELVDSITNSIAKIAEGKLEDAINYVEATMARTLPVIISFLAGLIGLGGVSDAIKDIITKLQAKVDVVIGKVIGFIVEKGKSLFGTLKAGVGKVVAWWNAKKKFTDENGEEHTLSVAGEQEPGEIMVNSDPRTLGVFLKESSLDETTKKKILGLAKKVDDLKYDDKGQSQSFSKSAGEKIKELLEEIARLLGKTDSARPPTKVTKETRTGAPFGLNGDGKKVHAEPLSIVPGEFAGSEPREESDLWKAVHVREGAYVRGHLLNHQVHGPGEIWNMTPIPQDTNKEMERVFEHFVKELVMEKNVVLSVEVEAEYGDRKSRQLREEKVIATEIVMKASLMTKRGNASGENANSWEVAEKAPADTPPKVKDALNKIRSVRQEVVLPADTGAGKLTVERLNLSNFHCADRPRNIKVSDLKAAALAKLDEYFRIGEKRAEAILDAKPANMDDLEAIQALDRTALESVKNALRKKQVFLDGRENYSKYSMPGRE